MWILQFLVIEFIKDFFNRLVSMRPRTPTIGMLLEIFGDSARTTAEGSSSHCASLCGHNGARGK